MFWSRKSPMSKIENLIRFAAQTFLNRGRAPNAGGTVGQNASVDSNSPSVFHNMFSDLLTITHNITGDDVGLPTLLQYAQQLRRHQATALYSGIFDSPLMSVCIFILYPKCTIPLHSHPGMYGILKVLHGEVYIRSFTSIQQVDYKQPSIPNFQAVESVVSMNKFSEPAVITPENNLHEVVNAKDEAAVFLDILSPRYESDNCYFSATECKPGVFELVQVPCPSTFYTITVPFPYKSALAHLEGRLNFT